ncbi:DUF1697 domain-containing protein [Sporichthya sp.]|uniref:DUF1697 domain-containing protein n=1 Tax=Sporichthya sp. TaxID=65475 RepID=UPI00182BEEB5|nr:DUF1697 domain-containing protein [Sporichthya sp.]MBA3743858.1 DUF1697 domain-containing protein [Sporichthya sp.]
MAQTRYVALLRGINVGGTNKVPMADLREVFESAGHAEVSTYIQSGNVLFRSGDTGPDLEKQIEAQLAKRFNVPLVVVVRSLRQLRTVVDKAPAGFGAEPDTFHSDAVFLRAPLTPAQAMKVVKLREGVDEAWAANGVVYFQRLSAQRTKSRMSAIVGTPEYQQMTIRSWRTTTKLLALLEA